MNRGRKTDNGVTVGEPRIKSKSVDEFVNTVGSGWGASARRWFAGVEDDFDKGCVGGWPGDAKGSGSEDVVGEREGIRRGTGKGELVRRERGECGKRKRGGVAGERYGA